MCPQAAPRGSRRAVLHLNVADFAAAVERAHDPGLRRRPLIVAHPGAARALVYDMSEEAFREGVRKQMALARALKLCAGARVVPPRPRRYEEAMAALLGRAQPFSPLVEAETDSGHLFLDLTGTQGLFGPPQDVAWRLRREVSRDLGLDPIWALAANKLVAKAASRVVKPDGEIIIPAGGEAAFMGGLPLHLVPGLEREDLLTLREYNLWRADQVIPWGIDHLEVVFGRRSGFVYRLLRGQDDAPVRPPGREPEEVRREHEFSEDTNHLGRVEATLADLAQAAGADLRRRGRVARRVVLVLEYSDGQRVGRRRSRQPGTANDFILYELARAALESAWTRRVRLRHLRLVCDRLCFPPLQGELFPNQEPQPGRGERLMAALDQIRGRHGGDKIRLGRSLAP